MCHLPLPKVFAHVVRNVFRHSKEDNSLQFRLLKPASNLTTFGELSNKAKSSLFMEHKYSSLNRSAAVGDEESDLNSVVEEHDDYLEQLALQLQRLSDDDSESECYSTESSSCQSSLRSIPTDLISLSSDDESLCCDRADVDLVRSEPVPQIRPVTFCKRGVMHDMSCEQNEVRIPMGKMWDCPRWW